MKTTISNLNDLGAFIGSLTIEQRQQPARVICLEGPDGNAIKEAEISEEPFLVHRNGKGEGGYPDELKRQRGDKFRTEDYEILDPIGTVILYTGEV